jgi:hypothetical protein
MSHYQRAVDPRDAEDHTLPFLDEGVRRNARLLAVGVGLIISTQVAPSLAEQLGLAGISLCVWAAIRVAHWLAMRKATLDVLARQHSAYSIERVRRAGERRASSRRRRRIAAALSCLLAATRFEHQLPDVIGALDGAVALHASTVLRLADACSGTICGVPLSRHLAEQHLAEVVRAAYFEAVRLEPAA